MINTSISFIRMDVTSIRMSIVIITIVHDIAAGSVRVGRRRHSRPLARPVHPQRLRGAAVPRGGHPLLPHVRALSETGGNTREAPSKGSGGYPPPKTSLRGLGTERFLRLLGWVTEN